jgi:hypothetical protein
MSTAVMTERIAEASPRLTARIAGVLWLISIAAAVFASVAGSALIVRTDAAATANNILANESLFRLSFIADFVAGLCYVGVTVLLYELLKPLSRSLSLLAAFFGLGGVTIGGASFLCRLVPLVLLRGDPYLSAFTTSQLQAMALMSLKLYVFGFSISMVLFGLQCFIGGYLIVPSTFLPRILGVLLAIAGAGYVISSFANFLSPSFGGLLPPFILPTGVVGEGSLALWLLVKGVNVQRWKEQAGATGE